MASIEAGLAYMREVLLQDELATSALLRGDDGSAAVNEHLWITTAAQMGMGFILPFALVFVAIPLETFVHSLRTVLGLDRHRRAARAVAAPAGARQRHAAPRHAREQRLRPAAVRAAVDRDDGCAASAAAAQPQQHAADGREEPRPGRRRSHEANTSLMLAAWRRSCSRRARRTARRATRASIC